MVILKIYSVIYFVNIYLKYIGLKTKNVKFSISQISSYC